MKNQEGEHVQYWVVWFEHVSEEHSARRGLWWFLTQPLVPGNLLQISAARRYQLPQTKPHPTSPLVLPCLWQLRGDVHTSCACRIKIPISSALRSPMEDAWWVDDKGPQRMLGGAGGNCESVEAGPRCTDLCTHAHRCVGCNFPRGGT